MPSGIEHRSMRWSSRKTIATKRCSSAGWTSAASARSSSCPTWNCTSVANRCRACGAAEPRLLSAVALAGQGLGARAAVDVRVETCCWPCARGGHEARRLERSGMRSCANGAGCASEARWTTPRRSNAPTAGAVTSPSSAVGAARRRAVAEARGLERRRRLFDVFVLRRHARGGASDAAPDRR